MLASFTSFLEASIHRRTMYSESVLNTHDAKGVGGPDRHRPNAIPRLFNFCLHCAPPRV